MKHSRDRFHDESNSTKKDICLEEKSNSKPKPKGQQYPDEKITYYGKNIQLKHGDTLDKETNRHILELLLSKPKLDEAKESLKTQVKDDSSGFFHAADALNLKGDLMTKKLEDMSITLPKTQISDEEYACLVNETFHRFKKSEKKGKDKNHVKIFKEQLRRLSKKRKLSVLLELVNLVQNDLLMKLIDEVNSRDTD